MKPVVFQADAETELIEAAAYYEAQQCDLGKRFLASPAKMKFVQAWVEIHKEDLLVDWKLAVAGEPVFKIDPLR